MEKLLVKSGLTDILLCENQQQVIKLFHHSIGQERIQREVTNTQIAKRSGIRVPEIYDVIQKGTRTGIVMEYIRGETITDVLSRAPYKIKTYAQKLARAHARLHQETAHNFTNQREFMRAAILQTQQRIGHAATTILNHLESLADGNVICHNDVHQENIVFTEKEPVLLDWAEATVGNPAADVIHSILVQEHPVPAPIFQFSPFYHRLHNKYRRYFARLYKEEYQRITHLTSEEIDTWILPVAATRLFTKSSPEEKDWTEGYINKHMRMAQ